MRATAQGQDSSLGVSAAAADNSTNESEVRELKQALEFARVEAKAAATNEAAVKAQAKVWNEAVCCSIPQPHVLSGGV